MSEPATWHFLALPWVRRALRVKESFDLWERDSPSLGARSVGGSGADETFGRVRFDTAVGALLVRLQGQHDADRLRPARGFTHSTRDVCHWVAGASGKSSREFPHVFWSDGRTMGR